MNDLKIKIKQSTLSLVIEQGFEGATISKIVKASGISNGGIYSNFKNREAVFTEIYSDIKDQLNKTILFEITEHDSCRQALYRYWIARTRYGLTNPAHLKYIDLFISSPYYSAAQLGSQYQILNQVMLKAMDENEIIRLDTDYLLIDLNANINGLLKYAALKPIQVTDDFIDSMFKKYWRSILNLGTIF